MGSEFNDTPTKNRGDHPDRKSSVEKPGTVIPFEVRIPPAVEIVKDLKRAAGARTESPDLPPSLTTVEQHYRTLVERPGLILIRVSLEGKLLYVSPHVKDVVGYPAEDFVGNRALIKRLLHPDDQSIYCSLVEARKNRSKKILDVEYRLRHKDGTYHWLYERQTPKLSESGAIEYYDSIVLDINERKQLQAQLMHAQRLETMGTFAAGIAHDFNNYLAAILGQISLSLNTLDPAHPCYSRLAAAEQAALCCAEMTKGLLTFGKQAEASLEPLNLLRLLDDIVQLQRHVLPSTIEVSLAAETHLKGVNGNYTELQQMLMNLGVNARDAMANGGALAVRARNIRLLPERDPAQYAHAPAGEYIEITVSDTGEGIPPAHLPYIFDPFFSTKAHERASGLGLSTVYSIVKSHKGYIQAASERGVGTTFTIVLPAIDLPENCRGSGAIDLLPRGHETILLADDDEMVLSMVRSVLEQHGYSVMTACDGREAVGIFKRNAGKIQLALIDQTMPKLTAREVLNEIYSISPDMRVILTSGYGRCGFDAPKGCGHFRFMGKPYALFELLSCVRELLDKAD